MLGYVHNFDIDCAFERCSKCDFAKDPLSVKRKLTKNLLQDLPSDIRTYKPTFYVGTRHSIANKFTVFIQHPEVMAAYWPYVKVKRLILLVNKLNCSCDHEKFLIKIAVRLFVYLKLRVNILNGNCMHN